MVRGETPSSLPATDMRSRAFDLSAEGVKKTLAWLRELELSADVFQADLNEYRLEERFDIVFSSGTLQYIPADLRAEILSNYKRFTLPGGIHAFTVPVFKPDLAKDPGADAGELDWLSGEILTHYPDWLRRASSSLSEDILVRTRQRIPVSNLLVNRFVAREPYN